MQSQYRAMQKNHTIVAAVLAQISAGGAEVDAGELSPPSPELTIARGSEVVCNNNATCAF